MRRISETMLGASAADRNASCQSSIFSRDFWRRTGKIHLESISSRRVRVQDYSTGQHQQQHEHDDVQLSMSSPDGSKDERSATSSSSAADLGSGLMSKPELQRTG